MEKPPEGIIPKLEKAMELLKQVKCQGREDAVNLGDAYGLVGAAKIELDALLDDIVKLRLALLDDIVKLRLRLEKIGA